MTEPNYLSESIKPDVPTIQLDAPRPAGVPDVDAYEAEVVRALDGTLIIVPKDTIHRYDTGNQSMSWPADGRLPFVTLGSRDAAYLGLERMLRDVRWYGYDLGKLLDGVTDLSLRPYAITTVAWDWPRWEQQDQKGVQALITEAGEPTIVVSGFNAKMLPETLDRYLPGTVLRELGTMIYQVSVVIWSASTEERSQIEARLTSLFMAERVDDRWGRRVVVPEYFNRQVRYELQASMRPDEAERAVANEWVLELRLTAEVQHVELVVAPGRLGKPATTVDASP